MRWALIAMLSVACSSRYGAYFVIEGEKEFDHVELYFGTASASSSFATPKLGPQSGTVFDRLFVTEDVAGVTGATATTFYVPHDDDNRALGDYVAVVATKGDGPVGIGEYFGFDVPSDEVHEYRLALVDYGQELVERWGAPPSCLAWKRQRDRNGSLVAVVRADDRDCDALVDGVDCNDLCSAGGTASCPDSSTVCSGTTGCAIGCVSGSGTCTPRVCIPPTACSVCSGSSDLTSRLNCAADTTALHTEVFIDMDANAQLCVERVEFSPGVPCTNAALEYADPRVSDGVTFIVGNNSSNCVVDIAVEPGSHLSAEHHLLISFDNPDGGARSSVMVGIQKSGNAQCGSYRVQPGGMIFSCR